MNWKLTTDLCGEPFVETWKDNDHEDLTLGYSMLRALAAEDQTLVEIAPNVWRHSGEGVTYMSKGEEPGTF